MSDFSRQTIKSLARKGIALVGLQFVPGPFGGATAYVLVDNGAQLLRSFREVLDLAAAA